MVAAIRKQGKTALMLMLFMLSPFEEAPIVGAQVPCRVAARTIKGDNSVHD
jgi:hypothetical protein